MSREATTSGIWLRFLAGAALTLLAVVALVFWRGVDSALLLGWAAGIIVVAACILFRHNNYR